MAQISISSLHVETIIGTLPEERLKKQTVIISVTFDFDARSAAENDDLTASVDYSAVERSIVSAVEKSSFLLLEALTLEARSLIFIFAASSQINLISQTGSFLL